MKPIRMTGALGYLMVVLWFLLLLAPGGAGAEPTEQSARHVAAADIIPDIEAALAARGAAPSAEITLADPDARVAVWSDAAVVFSNVSYNPASGRFVLRIDEPAPSTIAGVARTRQRAAVPNRLIARGETVSAEDFDWLEAVSPSTGPLATREEDVIGKIARRPLAEGAPIRLGDLAAPILVRRGDPVTMVLESPGIRLTQQGIAVSEGGAGDLIEIRNVSSDRVIKAVVVAERVARLPGRAVQGL